VIDYSRPADPDWTPDEDRRMTDETLEQMGQALDEELSGREAHGSSGGRRQSEPGGSVFLPDESLCAVDELELG